MLIAYAVAALLAAQAEEPTEAALLPAPAPAGEAPASAAAGEAPPPRTETPASRRVRAGVAHMRNQVADAPAPGTPSSFPAVDEPAEEAASSAPGAGPASAPSAVSTARPAPPPARKTGILDGLLARTSSGPLHYAFHYAPDYAGVAAMGALSLVAWRYPPPVATRAAFGSSYDPATRDASAVYAPRNDRLLGAPYREDTVPSWSIPLIGNAAVLAVGGLSLARNPSFRKVHHFILGAAQAQLASFLSTELLKSAAGRLRPDFRDRMARYYCASGRGDVPAETDCSGVNQEAAAAQAKGRSTHGIFIDREELEDGRRSFPSGHASSSFVLASYLALFIGGEMVWGEHANALTRLPGVAAQVAVFTAAALVAASRLSDGRHHPEDVVAGAGLGSAWGALFYFLHFNLLGRPAVRSFNLSPVTGRDGLGLSLNGLLPF